MPEWMRKSLSPLLGTILAAGVIVGLVPCSWGGEGFLTAKPFRDVWHDHPPMFARWDNGLPPAEKRKMEKQVEEWQSLSPEEKKRLRLRMEQWKQLPPQQRNLYKKRYNQWQQIEPKERRKLEDKLFRWDRLSPDERDQIRMKFRD